VPATLAGYTGSVFPPRPVLAHYAPALDGLRWHRVAGGFSGAEVWRGDDPVGSPVFALKGWPVEFPASRLSAIHTWLARAASLPFVPAVLPTAARRSFVVEAGRVWDVTRWMPGEPRESPAVAEIEAACVAVAHLHAAWRGSATREPCPGVLNRLRVLREWVGSRVAPVPSAHLSPDLNAVLARAAETVAVAAPAALRALVPWENVRLPVHPCVRDLRGDHVLFDSGEVTGIVDFGATAPDAPAIDLARLLADFAGDDEDRFRAGLNAYRSAGGTLDAPDDFVRILERAGVVCSVLGWLVRLIVARRVPPDSVATLARIERLLARCERIAES
jgi:Ser/Thr protein kinase RdoA (MazF antagonist)